MTINRLRSGRTVLLVALAVVLLLAWSDAAADASSESPSSVYGSWVAVDFTQGGMNMRSVFTIHADRIEVRSTCSYDGRSVVAEASSPARVTATEIEVLEARNVEKEHSPGFLQCRAKIQPMTLAYEVRGDTLVMTMPGSEKALELPRAAR